MAKVDFRKIPKKERVKLEEELFTALSNLGLKKKGEEFMRGLLTESEITMIARRVVVAKMLLAGRAPAQICAKLSVGENTVRAVERWLNEQSQESKSALPKSSSGYFSFRKK